MSETPRSADARAIALGFRIETMQPAPFSASPQVMLQLGVRAPEGQRIESVLLRTMLRIEAGARNHAPEEELRLRELFGDTSLWGRSSRSLMWAQLTSVINPFEGSTQVELFVPCSFDLAVIASKYLHALEPSEVPIKAQFSGTIFYAAANGLQAAPIPWTSEASYRMPVQVFRAAIDEHFPDSGVVAVRRELWARLERYRVDHGLASWDAALERLLAEQPQAVFS
jgi:hypothetical protein